MAFPVAPLHMWFDRRGEPLTAALTQARMATPSDRAGPRSTALVPSTSLSHVLWFQGQTDIHRRTAAYLEPMDYLNARFTGRIAATANSAMPMALTDNRTLGSTDVVRRAHRSGWSRFHSPSRADPVAQRLGIRFAAMWPTTLGLRRDVDVVTGANDSIAAAFGSGALDPGHATVMMGTTGVLTVHHPVRHVDSAKFIVTMPSALDDRYYVVAEAGLGGKLVEAALNEAMGRELADGPPDAIFEQALQMATKSPPGSRGVMFLPWVFGAMAPSPDPRHRGALLGISLSTARADLVRSLLEGISMQMRWLADEVEQRARHSVRPDALRRRRRPVRRLGDDSWPTWSAARSSSSTTHVMPTLAAPA